jgi:hypothetical protein
VVLLLDLVLDESEQQEFEQLSFMWGGRYYPQIMMIYGSAYMLRGWPSQYLG